MKINKRKRPQITVGETINFLKQFPDELLISCSESLLNEDEPEATQEFIYDDSKKPCVAIEASTTGIIFGYIGKEEE